MPSQNEIRQQITNDLIAAIEKGTMPCRICRTPVRILRSIRSVNRDSDRPKKFRTPRRRPTSDALARPVPTGFP